MIKTTHQKAISAYTTLGKISELPFMLPDARKIMLLKCALEKEAEFHDQTVQKLIRRYSSGKNESGGILFENVEIRDTFDKCYRELEEMEIEIDAEPITLNVTAYADKDLQMTPDQMKDLLGFVEFTED